MRRIGILGSIAFDHIFITQAVPVKGERVFGKLLGRYIGGMAANQAVEAARYSGSVCQLGMVGADRDGKEIKAHLTERNVSIDLLQDHPSAVTGQTYMHLVNDKSDYFSVVVSGANTEITAEDIRRELEGIRGGVLCLSLEINEKAAGEALRLSREMQIYTYLCASPAESCRQELLEQADALILNEREARILLGLEGDTVRELAAALLGLNAAQDLILLTVGKNGALLLAGGNIYYVPAYEVEVLDTVGAGDALTGAFVAARESGFSPYKALSYSCIAGSLAVSVVGAQMSAHTAEQVEAIYNKFYKQNEGIFL